MDNILIKNGDLEFLCEELSELEGFESPTSRQVFIDPPEREGSLFIGELAGRREFSFRGLIKDNIQINRRLLSRVCQPGGLKTLQFTTCDGIPVQTEAITKLTSIYRESQSPYLISCTSAEPYFVSQQLYSEYTGITVRSGGMAIPAPIPAPIGQGGGSPFIITNAGDSYAKPNFQIRGPGNNFLVQNLDTNESFRLVINMTTSEIVTINTTTNEAFKGNQNVFGSIVRDPIGTWIRLRPGENRIVFSAISGSSPITRLTIEWRGSYAGF